jgi:RNA polymerase sigma factor (sigma-70 family)
MKSFGSFDPSRGSGRAWLFGIARRVKWKQRNRTKREEALLQRAAGQWLSHDPDALEDLVARVDAEGPGRRLMRQLERLGPIDRAAVELVELAGLTPKETAHVLGVTPGAVRVRLLRARARLRKESEERE